MTEKIHCNVYQIPPCKSEEPELHFELICALLRSDEADIS